VVKLALSSAEIRNHPDELAVVVDRYGPEMWVDILVAAWVLAVSTYMRKGITSTAIGDKLLYFAPIVGSGLCAITIPFLPLFYTGPPGDWTRIYLPLIFSFATLLTVSYNAQH